jgi:protein-S-isoprenylcysteine O-methyltransferase Ste14
VVPVVPSARWPRTLDGMRTIHKGALGLFIAASVLYFIAPWVGLALGIVGAFLELWAWIFMFADAREREDREKEVEKPGSGNPT